MSTDAKRPAAGNGEPREIFNWTNTNIAQPPGQVKPPPVPVVILRPESRPCPTARDWLAFGPGPRVVVILDDGRPFDPGALAAALFGADAIILAEVLCDPLLARAEAARRCVVIVIAPVERWDLWIDRAQPYGLAPGGAA